MSNSTLASKKIYTKTNLHFNIYHFFNSTHSYCHLMNILGVLVMSLTCPETHQLSSSQHIYPTISYALPWYKPQAAVYLSTLLLWLHLVEGENSPVTVSKDARDCYFGV